MIEVVFGAVTVLAARGVESAVLKWMLSRAVARMITPVPGVRILVAAEPVEFHKGIDGLAAVVRQSLGLDPFARWYSGRSERIG